MLSIKTIIPVNGVTPDQIIRFFLNLDTEKYKAWHPGHLKWEYLEKDEKGLPKRLRIEENIGKYHFNEEFTLEEYKPGKLMRLRVKHKEPVKSYLTLSFNKETGRTIVTHELTFTFGYKPIDWLMNKLGLFNNFKKEVDKHATEEFKKLEKILINR